MYDSFVYEPRGFTSCAKNINIKDDSLDFTVMLSRTRAKAAAVFTRNAFCGAPLVVGKEHVADGYLQAIVVNSKNANVATGEEGLVNARETARLVAEELGIREDDVLPSSTGVIGRPLPMGKIRAGINGLKDELAPNCLERSARAIMTTDTRPKMRSARIGDAVLVGMCKGSGMIEPNMATMLAYFLTDAQLPEGVLQPMMREVMDVSFNMVSVDTDTSTSDTAVLMANGEAGPVNIDAFRDTFERMAVELAKEVASDGEGATKLLEVVVSGARTKAQAKTVAKSIVNSPLVKTAVYGRDPNWGRVAMAIGKCEDFGIEPNRVRIAFGDITVYDGRDLGEQSLVAVSDYLANETVVIRVDLRMGGQAAVVWGCDLTEEYVHINADYTT